MFTLADVPLSMLSLNNYVNILSPMGTCVATNQYKLGRIVKSIIIVAE